MKDFKISCPCHFGLESVLAAEAKKCEFKNVHAENGRVGFTGGFKEIARANINLRTAERVQIVIGQFDATSFEELFDEVSKLPFETYITKDDAFPVTGYSLDSKLASVPDCQSIIKKAVVNRLQTVHNVSWFEETGAKIRIQFGIIKDKVSVYLDTSGAGLHKRGYRTEAGEAPIKETLAAGIVNLARVYPDAHVYDPFCGSGTLLIEAALYALNIAPGLNRRFQFERWSVVDPGIIKEERQRAVANVRRDSKFKGYGFDIDPEALKLTKENAKRAGITSKISVKERAIHEFEAPKEDAIIITNPPYGERLLDIQEAVKLYRIMGDVFPTVDHLNYYIISSYEDFEIAYDKPADKRRKLYNGPIECQLYMYFNKKDVR